MEIEKKEADLFTWVSATLASVGYGGKSAAKGGLGGDEGMWLRKRSKKGK